MTKEKSKFNNTNITDKKRALSILKFFISRIKSGEFKVETAGWWSDTMNNGASLRIDVTADAQNFGIGEE